MSFINLVSKSVCEKLEDSLCFERVAKEYLRTFEWNGFFYRESRFEIPGIVKNYKYRPALFEDYNLDPQLVQLEMEKVILQTADFLDNRIPGFIVVGRQGGYWGISIGDAISLLKLDPSRLNVQLISDALVETMDQLAAERDVSELISNAKQDTSIPFSDLVDRVSETILDLNDPEEVGLQLINDNELINTLKFVDDTITSEELGFNERLKELTRGRDNAFDIQKTDSGFLSFPSLVS